MKKYMSELKSSLVSEIYTAVVRLSKNSRADDVDDGDESVSSESTSTSVATAASEHIHLDDE